MPLLASTRIGAYTIIELLGAGGMGQVYRARDTRLNRDVALKVLPDTFANDTERLARFTREAHTLASLNHPNIAHIYGLEESGTVRALVMELVEGEDVAQRLERGAMRADEALSIAKQIADALEAAHEHGIIHRDLKPANIKVRVDGTVKVLDFGLAKAIDSPGSSPDGSYLPTITSPAMTRAGVILGTAAYMAPEQARGKVVDKRADIWAFGCVLYEMLTGARAFGGAEVTDVLAAIVRDEPDWTRLPEETPAGVRRLLRRSLKKDSRQRLADIADARLELDEATSNETARETVAITAPAPWRRPVVWIAVIAAAALASAAAVGVRELVAPRRDIGIVRFDVPPPSRGAIQLGQPLSPDGRTLAFIVRSEGTAQIFIRPLDSTTLRALPGSDGATRSFWSPDSRHVAFFSDGNLKEVGIDGTPARLIARGPFRDGAWSRDGFILVGGQQGRPLMRVSAFGGEPVAETALDQSRGETSHDYPEFLPDGRHYLYVARRGVRTDDLTAYVGTLGSSERRELPGIGVATKYSPSGHLLFIRGTTLMAQSFSLDTLQLSGEAFPIAEQVTGGRVATFSVSDTGTLAFISRPAFESTLAWVDRVGAGRGAVGPAGVYNNARLSPDGRFLAFDRGTPPDLWTLDRERMVASKLTSDPAADAHAVWSPDGQTIAFTSNRGGSDGIYERTAGIGGDDRLLFRSSVPITLTDWSRDSQYLLYSAGGDLWALPLSGAHTPLQIAASPLFEEVDARFSPDGRWVSYQSNESTGITRAGEGDIFVQSFPQRGFSRQVSSGGGFGARWSSDGKELFYVSPDGMLMSVPVLPRDATLDMGAPKPLFRPRFGEVDPANARYDVANDGRFLILERAAESSIAVIVNWFEQLKRGRPTT